MPLAFTDTSTLSLNQGQQQQLANMQQQFVDAVGDPSSADYADRWNNAQLQIDEEFREMFGTQAFVQQQLSLARQGKQVTMPPQ